MNRLLLAFSFVFVVACSGSDAPTDSTAINDLIEVTQPTPVVIEGTGSTLISGTYTHPSLLEVGDCFNEYLYRDASEFLQQVTTIVGCDGPHDREAYFNTEFPAGENATYPVDEELERWADATCLDEFENFIGLNYVLSVLEIGAVVPTFEGWTSNQDRTVICYVFPDQGGRLLDSVRGTGI